MKTKIDYDQMNELLLELKKHDIPSKVILNLFDIGSLAEINVVQYNYLLLIIKS